MRDANAWSSESTLRRGREEGTRRFSIFGGRAGCRAGRDLGLARGLRRRRRISPRGSVAFQLHGLARVGDEDEHRDLRPAEPPAARATLMVSGVLSQPALQTPVLIHFACDRAAGVKTERTPHLGARPGVNLRCRFVPSNARTRDARAKTANRPIASVTFASSDPRLRLDLRRDPVKIGTCWRLIRDDHPRQR